MGDDDEGTAHLKKLEEDKKDFIKHAFKGGKVPNIMSLPVGKRDAEEDLEELETKVSKDKGHKKNKKARR